MLVKHKMYINKMISGGETTMMKTSEATEGAVREENHGMVTLIEPLGTHHKEAKHKKDPHKIACICIL